MLRWRTTEVHLLCVLCRTFQFLPSRLRSRRMREPFLSPGLMPKLCFFSFYSSFFYHLPPILACTGVGERGRCGTLDGEYHNDIIHMQPGLGNPSDAETKTIEKKRGGGGWIIEEHQRNRKPSLWIGSTFWECFKEHSIVGRKKKNSLRFIPRQKKALPWLRGGRVHRWKLTYCSPFICMKLFTTVSCCSVFLFVFFSPCLSPGCSIFLELGFGLCRSSFGRTQMLVSEVDN